MANPAPTINQINAFNATQGTTIDFNIIGGTELVRSNRIYIYDLSDNSLICTHLYVSTESIHELPANTDSSIVYESGKSSADFTNNTQYYAQIQTFTDVGGTQGGSGLSIAKLFWCLPTPTLTLSTIPTTISTTSYNVSATYAPNTSGSATNEIQEFQFNLYSAIGALLQTSGIVLYGEGVDLSYNFSGLEVDSTYYVTLDVTTTQGMNVSAQSNTFTVSIDTPTMGSASVVNNGCDGYISVTSNLSGGYEHEESADSGEIISFTTDSVNNITELDVDFSPVQDGTPWMSAQNTEPYTFRAVPTQTEDFGHESDTIVGGTIAWNQLIENGNFADNSHWAQGTNVTTSISVSDNVLTFLASGSGGGIYHTNPTRLFPNSATQHKYYACADIKLTTATTKIKLRLNGGYKQIYTTSTTDWQTVECLYSLNNTDNGYIQILDDRTSGWDSVQVKNVMLFDLTQMFGSTIADYIYSLEQANAGAGVAWFKKLFSNDYYEYNAGEIKSVEGLVSHDTTGKNLISFELHKGSSSIAFDSTKAFRVIANKTYNLSYTSVQNATSWRLGIVLFDKNGTKIYDPSFLVNTSDIGTNPSGQYYVNSTNGTLLSNKFTFNIDAYAMPFLCIGDTSNSTVTTKAQLEFGSTATDYEPYVKHTYPLDNDVVLRGIPKLDANNSLYYDGDIYHANGSIDRRYGIVDLGTLNWTYYSPETAFYCTIDDMYRGGGNLICDKYTKITQGVSFLNNMEFSYQSGINTTLWFKNTAYTDATTFKSAMSGVMLVYELATPSTQIADPYTNPQIVDPHGTEEYVGSPIPVGHKTTYQRICPISGWDSVGVVVDGFNLFDEVMEIGSISGATGNNSSVFTDRLRSTNYQPCKPNTSYYKGVPTANLINIFWYDKNKNYISYNAASSPDVVTSPSNAYFFRIALKADYGTTYNNDISINYPSTDHSYHAYNGTTYTSTFPKYKQQVSQDKTPYITKNIGDTYADTLTENLVGGTVAWNQSVPDTTTTHAISGSIASMDDAVAGNFESVVCDINPIQDLHGYDSPWVGGSHYNQWDEQYEFGYYNNSGVFVASTNGYISSKNKIKVTPSTDYCFVIGNGGSGTLYLCWYDENETFIQRNAPTLSGGVRVYTAPATAHYLNFSTETFYGTTYHNDIAVNYPSTVTTYSPWENICPISGWNSVRVVDVGTNQFDEDNANFATGIIKDDGTIASNYTEYEYAQSYTPVHPSTTYCVIGSAWMSGVYNYIAYYDASKTFISRYGIVADISTARTFTTPSNCYYIRIVRAKSTWTDYCINYPSTDTDYHAYNGTTYTTALGTTVYGGTLDVVSGVGDDEWQFCTFDGSDDEGWTMQTDYIAIWYNVPSIGNTDLTQLANWLVAGGNSYKQFGKFRAQTNGAIVIGNQNGHWASLDDFKADLASNPLQICYKKATADTLSVQGQSIPLLLGTNNIFADSGDVFITYPTNHSYQSLSATHKYYKRINGVESISVGSDVVADVGTDSIIDLTQMFGTTIADYIYNREQSSSSGMGVKFFKSLFPNDDYDYNSGELISVNASAHVIKDANGNVVHTYPLDSDLVLRGIPKLDANNKLYYDGDVYQPNGSVTRKYGIVDLGTLTWGVPTSAGTSVCQNPPSNMNVYTTKPFGICNRILLVTSYSDRLITDGTIYSPGSNQLNVLKSSFGGTTAASVKSALSGVYLVYELATPTTESADPFEENQAIVPSGIEEYTVTEQGDVEMPVGHDSTYYTTKVYGGTIDMAKGVLTINMASVDLGSQVWSAGGTSDANAKRMFADIPNAKVSTTTSSVPNIFCPIYESISPNETYSKVEGITIDTTNSRVWVYDNRYNTASDVAAFKSAMNGVQLVYELETPIEISLTPQQMQTLSGQNNIWSNTNGGMYLVYQLPITSLLVKRRDVADVSGKWLTLYSTPITQASDMDFTFIDFLNQYGKKYQYALVPVLAQNQSGVIVQIEGGYTVSDNVDSIFDGVYIADQTNVERVKAGVGYGNIDMNQGVGSITPIGSKYPIVITNSQNQYHNGSIRGTIVPNDFYSNGNLSRIDMVNKRDELEQFLTNKRAKIIKDWNGKMWLVMIMSNVNCSFNDNYGMGMVSFSADWLEVGDPTNQQDLYNAGLINVGGV